MRVKFTHDALYETEGYRKGHTFKAGEIHDFNDDFAQRWIRRGVATPTDETAKFKPLTRVVGKAEEPAEEVDLESMTKAELEEHAAKLSIDISGAKTKADLIEAIEGAA